MTSSKNFSSTKEYDPTTDRDAVLEAINLSRGIALRYADKRLKADRILVLEAIKSFARSKSYGSANPFRYADKNLKSNYQFVLEIIRTTGKIPPHIDDSLWSDHKFVIEVIKGKSMDVVDYLDKKLWSDHKFVIEAFQEMNDQNIFTYSLQKIDMKLLMNPEVAIEVLKKGNQLDCRHDMEFLCQTGLHCLSDDERLWSNPKFVIEAMKLSNGEAFEYAHESLLSDKDFVLESIKLFKRIGLRYGIESLKINREFVLDAVKEEGLELEFADKRLQADPEIVLTAIKSNSNAIDYVDKSLWSNRKFVLEAIKVADGRALEYADETLKADREFVLKVVKDTHGNILSHADKILKADREVVFTAIKSSKGQALQHADENLKTNREFVLKALKLGASLRDVGKSLCSDREVVLTAVKSDGNNFKYADKSLKADREVVLESMNHAYGNDMVLGNVDKNLWANRKFVLEAIKLWHKNTQNRFIEHPFQFANERLRSDREVALEAIKSTNGKAFLDTDPHLRADRQFILEAIKVSNGLVLPYVDKNIFNADPEVVLTAIKLLDKKNFKYSLPLRCVDESLWSKREFVFEVIKNNIDYIPCDIEVGLLSDHQVRITALNQILSTKEK